MVTFLPYLYVLLFLLSCALTFFAFTRSKSGSFYGDTPQWFWLGVYVWGDGLVLGPFWALSALVWHLLPLEIVLSWVLIFFAVRSIYEVIFWMLHQYAKKDYRPPFLRKVAWLDSESVAIIYQVFHTCVAVLCLVALFAMSSS
jgi:hypothetical protein